MAEQQSSPPRPALRVITNEIRSLTKAVGRTMAGVSDEDELAKVAAKTVLTIGKYNAEEAAPPWFTAFNQGLAIDREDFRRQFAEDQEGIRALLVKQSEDQESTRALLAKQSEDQEAFRRQCAEDREAFRRQCAEDREAFRRQCAEDQESTRPLLVKQSEDQEALRRLFAEQFSELRMEIDNTRRMARNSSAMDTMSLIVPLINAEGLEPNDFPQTRGALVESSIANINTWLGFYDVPNVPTGNAAAVVTMRKSMLLNHLGLR